MVDGINKSRGHIDDSDWGEIRAETHTNQSSNSSGEAQEILAATQSDKDGGFPGRIMGDKRKTKSRIIYQSVWVVVSGPASEEQQRYPNEQVTAEHVRML